MILSCVTILRYLVQYNALLRHTLAVDRNLLLDILRCRIAYHDNEAIHYETSCLVLFIIFDEVFSKTGNEVVVPILIAKRYLFVCSFVTLLTFQAKSASFTSYLDHTSDFQNGSNQIHPARKRFPFFIRVAWHGG